MKIDDFSKYPKAGFFLRLIAFIMDFVLLIIVLVILNFFLVSLIVLILNLQGTLEEISLLFNKEWLDNNILVLSTIFKVSGFFSFIFSMGWFIICWSGISSTPGKRIFGLKIISIDGEMPIGFGRATIRFLGYVISLLTFTLGFILIGLHKKKQGLHDIIAGTYVIKYYQ